jgi:hypothetical protein
MNDEERKAWDLWIDYCIKLNKWYKANPDKAAEYEPIMLMPPFDAIVESNLAADAELTALRLIEQRAGDVEGLCLVLDKDGGAWIHLMNHERKRIASAVSHYLLEVK